MPDVPDDDDSMDFDNNNNNVDERLLIHNIDYRDDDFLPAIPPHVSYSGLLNQREGCCSRVKSDMMDFNGNKRCLAQTFILIDCLIQNMILYLIWFQFIPNGAADTDGMEEDRVFISNSQ